MKILFDMRPPGSRFLRSREHLFLLRSEWSYVKSNVSYQDGVFQSMACRPTAKKELWKITKKKEVCC